MFNSELFISRLDILLGEDNNNLTNLLQALGLSPSKGTAWRKGQSPKVEYVGIIADHYNVSIDWLVGRSDKREPAQLDEDGFEKKFNSLSLDLQQKFLDFLEVAKDNPESAERFLSFAVQEIQSS